MKKTVSVNIKGINFIIEEDAYETLSNYLKRLTESLSNSIERKEIIDDIELRISELCNLKLIIIFLLRINLYVCLLNF